MRFKASLENGYLTISAEKGLDKDEQEKRIRSLHPQGGVTQEPAAEAFM